jgi:hypothetical protein
MRNKSFCAKPVQALAYRSRSSSLKATTPTRAARADPGLDSELPIFREF